MKEKLIKTENIKATVSGSFDKFKPEIDLAITELQDLGVTVLAPDKGWLYIPPTGAAKSKEDFRPLPSERYMNPKQVEDSFLNSIRQSDFLYVLNLEGYIGNTVSLEIGFAVALEIPVFMNREPSILLDLDERWEEIKSKIVICTIQEAVDIIRTKKDT